MTNSNVTQLAEQLAEIYERMAECKAAYAQPDLFVSASPSPKPVQLNLMDADPCLTSAPTS